ncbi:MAG: hypothetical protein POELPBGB_02470 [Bacteroidia bacterium]|nr:hypothetical protein [Bacteroidia bacterium]
MPASEKTATVFTWIFRKRFSKTINISDFLMFAPL